MEEIVEIHSQEGRVILGRGALQALQAQLALADYSSITVLTDANTHRDCWPLLQPFLPAGVADPIVIPAGEAHKNLVQVTHVWERLSREHLDRQALLINLGGGMVGDLGGFAAACYKRGIAFMQVPTSLLAMVDASIGGKVGIDFQGFKNQIGAFRAPDAVFVYPPFLQTLPERERIAGFAEMVKHALIADQAAWQEMRHWTSLPDDFDPWIAHAIRIKAAIVDQDPTEQGPRKALNFGHTLGHAIESYFLQKQPDAPLLHGEAVAWGLVMETWISHQLGWVEARTLQEVEALVSRLYDRPEIGVQAFEQVIGFALQDKKNAGGEIRAALVRGPGACEINVPLTRQHLEAALAFCFVSPSE